MGSFNAKCVITGLHINYGDEIVAVPVKRSKYAAGTPQYPSKFGDWDAITSAFYPITFPIFGTYDDYGRIEVTSDRCKKILARLEEDNDEANSLYHMMYMHKFAYDLAVKDYASDFWIEHHTERRKETEDELKRLYAGGLIHQLDDGETEKMDAKELMRISLNDSMIRHQLDRIVCGYLPIDGQSHWKNIIMEAKTFDDAMVIINKFRDTIGALEDSRNIFGYQFRPTYYGDQDTDLDAELSMAEASVKFLKQKIKKFND